MRLAKFFLAALLSGLFVCAQVMPKATPAEAGFSAARLDRITQLLREDTEKGTIPGAVLLIARKGKVAYWETVGMQDSVAKTPMAKDSIFRIYSMSKPVTSVAAMMLAEEGRLKLSDPVAKFIPSFAGLKVGVEKQDGTGKTTLDLVPPRRPMTIQDLLRHTSGLTYGIFGMSAVKRLYLQPGALYGDCTNEEFVERLSKLPLAYQPGSTWEYSHSTDVLGRVVEVVSGMTLYEFEKKRLFDPLGMPDTAYYLADKTKHSRIAEALPAERMIAGAPMANPRVAPKFESGGGGLVSTAGDYARFLQMLVGGGTYGGKRYLSPKTIAFMTSDHIAEGVAPGPMYLPGAGHGFGLGFAVRRAAGVSSSEGSAGDYWWNGIAGTNFWVDPKEEMFVIFMVQAPRQLQHYKDVIRNMVYAAMER